MQFDGHVKLTKKAVKKLKANCPTVAATCNAPMFKETPRYWLNDSEKSNPVDNYSAGVFNYLGHFFAPDVLVQVLLPDKTAFVDLDEFWTHDDPKGQRFHFMRAETETDREAYINAVRFIKTHADNWVNAAKDIVKEKSKPKPLQSASWRETRGYVKELALALHALQDSFAPSHAHRYHDVIIDPYRPSGFLNNAAPIRKLFIYAKQDHSVHGDKDYISGGTESGWGNLAVDASADLMAKGLLSIPAPGRGLIKWEEFKDRWLPYKPQ